MWQSLRLVDGQGEAVRGFDVKSMENDGRFTKLNIKVCVSLLLLIAK